MIASAAAAAILEALVEHKTIESKVMIVVAHPDDETIGIGALLCRCWYRSLTVLRTMSAMRMRTDLRLLRGMLLSGGPNSLQRSKSDKRAVPELTGRLSGLQRTEVPDAIFVHAYEGGHPDHDAASLAVSAACGLIEARGRSVPAIIEMTGYHANGRGLATGVFLPSQHAVETESFRKAPQYDFREPPQ